MRKESRKKAAESNAKRVAQSVPSSIGESTDAPSYAWIAVELGGEWPALLATEGRERRVITQLEAEAPAAFAERVASRIDALSGRGVRLCILALACNERVDGAADEARRSLVGLALGAMAKHRAGNVYLTASPRSSGRIRHYLTELARSSSAEWQSAGLEISVDFGGEAPRAVAGTLRARVA